MPIRIIKVEDGKHQIITTDESHCNILRREEGPPVRYYRIYSKDNIVLISDCEPYEEALREWRRKQTSS